MESLQDILGGKDFKAPDEIQVVKDYVRRKYKSPCSVQIQRDVLILKVPNSSLASMVRLEQNRLIESCGIKHKLMIRWGRLS